MHTYISHHRLKVSDSTAVAILHANGKSDDTLVS